MIASSVADGRMRVPRVLRGLLYILLIASAALSVPRVGDYSPLPVATLLDIWIVLLAAACLARGQLFAPGLLALLVAYSLTRVVPAMFTGAPFEDFAQAYRWLLYLVVFIVVIGRSWGPVRPLIRVTFTLLILALLKTGLTVAVLGLGSRSGLLIENNFEMALFVGLVAVLYPHFRKAERIWAVILLSVLVFSSGSRSGAVALACLVIYVLIQTRVNIFFRYLMILTVPALIYLVAQVFIERATEVGGAIDRLNFLRVFTAETAAWSPLDWLIGTVPLTPLQYGCSTLSFYEGLFASSGDGSCYAVIMHAFILRVVFDAGIVGLALAVVVTFVAMRKAGVSRLLAFTLIGVAIANSLSVSGLNSPYVALPVVVASLVATVPLPDARASPGHIMPRGSRALLDERDPSGENAPNDSARDDDAQDTPGSHCEVQRAHRRDG